MTNLINNSLNNNVANNQYINEIQTEYIKSIMSNNTNDENQPTIQVISINGYKLNLPITIYYISKILKNYYDQRTGYIFENLEELKIYGHIYFKNTELENINFQSLNERDIYLGDDKKKYSNTFHNYKDIYIYSNNVFISFQNFNINQTTIFLPDNITFGSFEKDESYMKYTFDFLLGRNFDIYDKLVKYDKFNNKIYFDIELYCFYNIITWIEAEKAIETVKLLFNIESYDINYLILEKIINLDIFYDDFTFLDKIDRYLNRKLNIFNCLTFYDLSEKYNLSETKKNSSIIYSRHSNDVIKCYHYNKYTSFKYLDKAHVKIKIDIDRNLNYKLLGNTLSTADNNQSINTNYYKIYDDIFIIGEFHNHQYFFCEWTSKENKYLSNNQETNNFTKGYIPVKFINFDKYCKDNILYIIENNSIDINIKELTNKNYEDTINIIVKIQNNISNKKKNTFNNIKNIYKNNLKSNYNIGKYMLSNHVNEIISEIEPLITHF